MEPEIEKLARTYLRCPVKVTIGGKDEHMNMRIRQEVRMLEHSQKSKELLTVLKANPGLAFVFVNQRQSADELTRALKENFLQPMILHAGRSTDERKQSLQQIREGRQRILVATDVAARGLDVENVQLVVNYDCPTSIQRYTHRIGRTARAGEKGLAITFLTKDDENMYYDIRKYMVSTKQMIPKEFGDHPRAMAPAGQQSAITY